MTYAIKLFRSLAFAVVVATVCQSVRATGDTRRSDAPIPACPAVTELERVTDIGTLQRSLMSLNADLVGDLPDDDACDPSLKMSTAMKRGAPLCEVMGVNAYAIALGSTASALPVKTSVSAVITYILPYGDDAHGAIVAHLRDARFEHVKGDPYPALTFRKKPRSWEIDEFYQRGDLYVHLVRDTDFKKFTMAIGSAAAIRLMTRDLNSCN